MHRLMPALCALACAGCLGVRSEESTSDSGSAAGSTTSSTGASTTDASTTSTGTAGTSTGTADTSNSGTTGTTSTATASSSNSGATGGSSSGTTGSNGTGYPDGGIACWGTADCMSDDNGNCFHSWSEVIAFGCPSWPGYPTGYPYSTTSCTGYNVLSMANFDLFVAGYFDADSGAFVAQENGDNGTNSWTCLPDGGVFSATGCTSTAEPLPGCDGG